MPSRCFAQLVSAPGAEKRLRSSLEAFGSPTRGSHAVSQADSTTQSPELHDFRGRQETIIRGASRLWTFVP